MARQSGHECWAYYLTGRSTRLEPLRIDHTPALAQVGLHSELWRLQPAPIMTLDAMYRYVQTALDDQKSGSGTPFVIIASITDKVIGSTRHMDTAPAHLRLEIGATWLTPTHQRSRANTEAKLLLLSHAFKRCRSRRRTNRSY